MRCPECGGRVVLTVEGVSVCESCGLVVDEILLESAGRVQRGAGRRAGGCANPVALGTVLHHRDSWNLSASRRARLARIQALSPFFGQRSTRYRVVRAIGLVCSKRGIPDDVRDRAVQLYVKSCRVLSGMDLVRRPSYFNIAAAALVVAVKERGLDVPVKDVVRGFVEQGHRVKYSHMIDALVVLKEIAGYRVAGDLRAYVYRVVRRAVARSRIRDKEEAVMKIYREALSLLGRVDRRRLAGRNPYVVALAAVYAAVLLVFRRKRSRLVSQRLLAEVSGFSESSIRSNYRRFFEGFVTGVLRASTP